MPNSVLPKVNCKDAVFLHDIFEKKLLDACPTVNITNGATDYLDLVQEDDFIDYLFVANTHDYMLCFTNLGRIYWLKVYEVPQGTRGSRGKPIVGLLPLQEGEKISAILPVKEFSEDQFVAQITENGTINKQPLSAYAAVRRNGLNSMKLDENDKRYH